MELISLLIIIGWIAVGIISSLKQGKKSIPLWMAILTIVVLQIYIIKLKGGIN